MNLLLSGYFSLRTKRDVRSVVEKVNPDIAIVQNVFPLISPSIYTTLSDLKFPVIQAVYNYRFVCPEGELYTEGSICERCIKKSTIQGVIHKCYRNSYFQSAWYASIIGIHRRLKTITNNIDLFMVPDLFLGNKLIQGGIPEEKIFCNPNPFFVDEFEPSFVHENYFLFVGRLVRQKGIFTLIDAVEKANPSVKLLIVGQGENQAELEDRIKSPILSSRVTFLGPRWGKEVVDLIRKSIGVVIPSEWYDNLPLILCQANACGKPVIASRINGIPEYVNDGENGYLFTTGDSTELSQKLNQIQEVAANDSSYRQLSCQSREYAEKTFDYLNHHHKLMEMIAQLKAKP
jgi:glycosyltransferase involved in cell wall biosynthesis